MNRITLSLLFVIVFAAAGSSHAVFADEASVQFNAAKTQFDSKQYESARSGFDAFLTRFPAHAQAAAATFYLAESLMFLKRYSLAESYYSRLTALGLNDQYAKVALFRLADILYIQGQYDLAKPRLEEFVEKLPHDTNLQFVLYYLGDIAMRNNAATEAKWYFGQADRIFPDGAKAAESKLGLAWAKNKLGEQTEANALYQQLINSNSPAVAEQAAYQWGVALFERGAFQESIAAFTEFQRKYPASASFADSYRVIARCKGRLNDFDGALQTLTLISPQTTDDKLMKVRMLYGLKKNTEAKDALTDAERTATAAYRDEIALLKSVFLFDQRDWKTTITLLESVLAPQFDAAAGRMTLTYSSLPIAGVNKLSEAAQFRAYSLLTQAYARNGETAKAHAMLAEMQKQAAVSDKTILTTICSDTSAQLTSIEQNGWGNGSGGGWNHRPNRPPNNGSNNFSNNGSNHGSNNGQWSPSPPPNNELTALAPITSGTDLERFWHAIKMYSGKNYAGAVQQLEPILNGYYDQTAAPKQYSIFYKFTGAEGTFDEITFAKACSVLTLSKAGLGDMEQAQAVLAAFASRIRMTDTGQKTLLQKTQQDLFAMSGIASGTANGTANGAANNSSGGLASSTVLSDADQRRLLREANTLYKSDKFDQADAKLRELIAARPSETNLAEALLLQGKTKYKLHKDAEGIALLDRIVNEFPSEPACAEALWYFGLYYDSCGDSVKSAEYFQQLAEKFPNFKYIDGALYFLAADDLQNGSGRKAQTYLTRIYRNYQNGTYWTHAVWTLAYEAYKKGQYNQAEIYLQKVLDHPPDWAVLDKALYLKGELSLRKNDYETAFLAFREVGKLCPESPLCSYAVRNAQIAAGKTVKVN